MYKHLSLFFNRIMLHILFFRIYFFKKICFCSFLLRITFTCTFYFLILPVSRTQMCMLRAVIAKLSRHRNHLEQGLVEFFSLWPDHKCFSLMERPQLCCWRRKAAVGNRETNGNGPAPEFNFPQQAVSWIWSPRLVCQPCFRKGFHEYLLSTNSVFEALGRPEKGKQRSCPRGAHIPVPLLLQIGRVSLMM